MKQRVMSYILNIGSLVNPPRDVEKFRKSYLRISIHNRFSSSKENNADDDFICNQIGIIMRVNDCSSVTLMKR